MNRQKDICTLGREEKMANRSDRIETEVPRYFIFLLVSNSIGSNRFEVGELSNFARHVPTGPTSPRQSIAVWALSTIPNEAINREPQRVATGATAAPTDTDHSTAYPGGSSSKKKHGGCRHNLSTSSIGQAGREPSDRPKIQRKSSGLR